VQVGPYDVRTSQTDFSERATAGARHHSGARGPDVGR